MEITLEKKEQSTANLKVNLKASDYQPKVAEKVKEYSKKVNIKGFRPGKVPASLIERMYGKSIKVDEINHIISNSVHEYIRENKISILGDPLPDADVLKKIDWENQTEFEFIYNLGLVPDFKYDLEKAKVNKYSIQTEDKVLNETLENLRNQYGKSSNPEESTEGDFLYGDLKEIEGDYATQTLIPLNKIIKGELKKFVGKTKGDKIEFDIKKAFEDADAIAHATGLSKEDAEAKKGKFELTVTNISRTEPAAMDQEFFDKIFGKDLVKSESEFNEKLKETISENYQRETEHKFARDIQEALVENTKIELPDAFLKKWLLISNEGKITEEQIEKEYHLYLKELKWNLIRNKIGEDNEIKVENEDINKKTKEMILQQFGNMPLSEELNESLNKIAENYLQQDKGKNYMKMFEQVFFEKVMEVIKGKVNTSEKKVTVDEFRKQAGF